MALIKLPGLIDPHVHLRDPGQTEKEDFYTGTAAALAGGFTTVLDMPNNSIPITTEKLLDEKIAIAKEKTVSDIGFYFGSLGDNLSEFEKVKNKVFGLKLYLNETTGNFIIDSEKLFAIYDAWPKDAGPILIHGEGEILKSVIDACQKTGKKTHICHVANQEDVQIVLTAKEQHLPITCGVTPHHLFLTEEDAKKLGKKGMVKPPLQRQIDVDFLWQNLNQIDVIESDHAPHLLSEKNGEGETYGFPSLETTLPLLLTAVSENRLHIEDIMRLCSTNPAKIFGVKKYPETVVCVDTEVEYRIENEKLHTKCTWSPYKGMRMKGKIITVEIKGTVVFENGELQTTAGDGKIIYPQLS